MPFPKTSDGRIIYQASRFRGDVDPYICGLGDDRTNGKGQGGAFNVGWATAPAANATLERTWYFNDWVYVSAGGIEWKGGERGDTIDMWVDAPLTVATANGGNTGNCNRVLVTNDPVNLYTYVPADNDGDHDINLSAYDVVPVPAYDAAGNPVGYWDWDDPDEGVGTLTPKADGTGHYSLYSWRIKLVHWVCGLPLLGDGATLLDPQTKARKMLPHWEFTVRVKNGNGHAPFDITWWLNTARKNTT